MTPKTPKTIDDLKAEMKAATSLEDRARLASEITQRRVEQSKEAEAKLVLECTILECELREEHGLDPSKCYGIASIDALKTNGCGIIVVRDFSGETAEKERKAAVASLGSAYAKPGEGLIRAPGFQVDDEAIVTTGLLKACLHPNPKTEDGKLLIQQLVRDQFPFCAAAYRQACSMTVAGNLDTSGK